MNLDDHFIFEGSPFETMSFEKITHHVRVFNKDDAYWILECNSVIAGYEPFDKGSESEVQCICSANLYFDGFRHIYFGQRGLNGTQEIEPHYGYFYYANLETLHKVLDKLKEIDERVNAEHLKHR